MVWSMHGEDDKIIRNFTQDKWGEETTCEDRRTWEGKIKWS
jgi:hypothetical protein